MLKSSSFVLLVFFFYSPLFAAVPDWYIKQNLRPDSNSVYFGYGSGESLAVAKHKARSDISQQIRVSVKSLVELRQEVSASGIVNEAKNISSQNSQSTLNDLRVIRSELHDGIYYIVLEYKLQDIYQVFEEKLQLFECKNEMQHAYLKHTPMFKKLNASLRCERNISLARKDGVWYLSYRNVMVPIQESQMEDLYFSTSSRMLSLKTSSNRLKQGSRFFFNIKSTTKGYVSLFNVFSGGKVNLLQENIPIEANVIRKFPSDEEGIVFEAGLAGASTESVELFVGIFTESIVNHANFKEASNYLNDSDKFEQFDDLLLIMAANKFSSDVIRISSR